MRGIIPTFGALETMKFRAPVAYNFLKLFSMLSTALTIIEESLFFVADITSFPPIITANKSLL